MSWCVLGLHREARCPASRETFCMQAFEKRRQGRWMILLPFWVLTPVQLQFLAELVPTMSTRWVLSFLQSKGWISSYNAHTVRSELLEISNKKTAREVHLPLWLPCYNEFRLPTWAVFSNIRLCHEEFWRGTYHYRQMQCPFAHNDQGSWLKLPTLLMFPQYGLILQCPKQY